MLSVLPIFLHIPRTAGTSIRVMLERQIPQGRILSLYGDRITDAQRVLETGPETVWNSAIIRGHITFGIHKWIDRPCSYFTMLRNPLTRLISLYKYIQRDRTHWAHDETRKMSFNQFMDSGVTLETNNGMVRQLCESEGPLPQETYGKATTAFGECVRALLEEALHNLTYFEVVGRTEYYQQSIQRICSVYGWKPINVGKVNATATRKNIDIDLDLFRQLNELDIELYESGGKTWQGQSRSSLEVVG